MMLIYGSKQVNTCKENYAHDGKMKSDMKDMLKCIRNCEKPSNVCDKIDEEQHSNP